jgi:hypothetical protein
MSDLDSLHGVHSAAAALAIVFVKLWLPVIIVAAA